MKNYHHQLLSYGREVKVTQVVHQSLKTMGKFPGNQKMPIKMTERWGITLFKL